MAWTSDLPQSSSRRIPDAHAVARIRRTASIGSELLALCASPDQASRFRRWSSQHDASRRPEAASRNENRGLSAICPSTADGAIVKSSQHVACAACFVMQAGRLAKNRNGVEKAPSADKYTYARKQTFRADRENMVAINVLSLNCESDIACSEDSYGE